MDKYLDIDTINIHDFNTPRRKQKSLASKNTQNKFKRLGSNNEISFQSPNSIQFQNNPIYFNDQNNSKIKSDWRCKTINMSPFIPRSLRMSNQDIRSNVADYNSENFDSNLSSILQPGKQQRLQSFSFSKETHGKLSQQNIQEYSLNTENNEKINTIQKSLSPMGIPFQPFHHTKSNFKSKSQADDLQNQQQSVIQNQNSYNDDYNNDNQKVYQFNQYRNRSCMIQRDKDEDILNRCDSKLQDISDTLKQCQQYKINLNVIQKKYKRRSKSQHTTTPTTKTEYISKLPAIKQPNMYFSPIDSIQPNSTKKLKKSKKQKQQGLQQLANQILNNLPQEKLANLMAINMYNKALFKKEQNQEKITNVIEEQNKLLTRMLDQYDKRLNDQQRRKRSNQLVKIQNDKNYDTVQFERDKSNFEKIYSNIQQKFQDEVQYNPVHTYHNDENYMYEPLLTEGDLPDQIRNTKHLKRIHTHTQKYRQFTPTKVFQPPMQF